MPEQGALPDSRRARKLKSSKGWLNPSLCQISADGDGGGMHRAGRGKGLGLGSALQALISVSGEESTCLEAKPEMGNPKPGLWNKDWWPGCQPTRLGKGPAAFWVVPGGTGMQRRGAAA